MHHPVEVFYSNLKCLQPDADPILKRKKTIEKGKMEAGDAEDAFKELSDANSPLMRE